MHLSQIEDFIVKKHLQSKTQTGTYQFRGAVCIQSDISGCILLMIILLIHGVKGCNLPIAFEGQKLIHNGNRNNIQSIIIDFTRASMILHPMRRGGGSLTMTIPTPHLHLVILTVSAKTQSHEQHSAHYLHREETNRMLIQAS